MTEYIVDFGGSMAMLARIIESQSANLREEIVRCRDCYFADEIEGGYWCDRFECGKEPVTPGGFCAWAIRRNA